MERSRLKAKRRTLGLSQETFAEKCGVSVSMVQRWEAGTHTPQPCNLRAICGTLGITDVHTVDIYMEGEDFMDLNRREAIIKFLQAANIPFILGSDGNPILTMSIVVTPGDFLKQSDAGLKVCWQLLNHRGFKGIEEMLNASTPRLTQMATTPSSYQDAAAELMVQAKIMEAILCTHRTDYTGRKIASMQAVDFAKAIGDTRLQAYALMTHAFTYVIMPSPRPDKAIPIFLEALSLIGVNAPLQQCDALVGLANAYAQGGNEGDTLRCIKEGEAVFLEHIDSRQDIDWLYGHGFPEFYSMKGRAYLRLAPHASGYPQMAYDTFESLGSSLTTPKSIAQAMIFQADAARILRKLELFAPPIERGLVLASQIGSQQRQNEAATVFKAIPDAWRDEPQIQRLQRNFAALAVV